MTALQLDDRPGTIGSSVSLDIRERLRADIVEGRLDPGDKLRFVDLQSRYEAGIGTLREALTHLVSEGFIHFDTGRGFRVAPVSVEDLLDVTELRLDFEVRALRDAMSRGDEQWEAVIVTAYHLLSVAESVPLASRLKNPDEWTRRHRNFHLALVAACRSSWLRNFHRVLFDQAQRYRIISLRHRPPSKDRTNEHKDIMQAVLARNTKRAFALSTKHIKSTVDDVLKYTPHLTTSQSSRKSSRSSRKK